MRIRSCLFFAALLSLAAACQKAGGGSAVPDPDPDPVVSNLVKGADISWCTELESKGYKFYNAAGQERECTALLKEIGADAVRLGMLLCASAGNDILYDESQVEQGRNFCGKIWNSWRLVSGWRVDPSAPQGEASRIAVKWFDSLLSRTIRTVEDHYSKFRISGALMAIYKLFWDDYCSWYLELVKPAYGEAIDGATFEATVTFFDKLLKLIHPVMPFITEELWHSMAPRRDGETIMYERTPKAGPCSEDFLADFDIARQVITGVRGVRAQKQIGPREPLKLCLEGDFPREMLPVVFKSAGVSGLVPAPGAAAASFLVGTVKCSVPLEGLVDTEAEKAKLLSELEHQQKFLAGVRAKLGNPAFVGHAPEAVVANERKKEADALSRIASLQETLKSL